MDSVLARQKREVAKKSLEHALRGDYKSAAKVRQEAYALDPPGTIGVNWDSWEDVWEKDSRYLHYLKNEDFSDVNCSKEKIESMKAGIFIDYLFDFRDCWGVSQAAASIEEEFFSASVENFLISKNWTFRSENREFIYTDTKKKNIGAKIYYDAIREKGIPGTVHPYIFKMGEYDLGFMPDAPEKIINGRRKWLETYDQYLDMSEACIEGFPKTFQTFEKHKRANDAKFKSWMDEYTQIKRRRSGNEKVAL